MPRQTNLIEGKKSWMMTPECWTEIIIKRLKTDPFKDASALGIKEWLAELVEEIQIDAQPAKGNA